jgi:7-carboxy-7-deazaguanine synthase
VIVRVRAFGLPLVEVTGGEPLQQPGCGLLLAALLEEGLRVLLETSGAEDVGRVPAGVHVVMDLKAPSSGQSHRMRWENLDVLGTDAEIKIVLADRRDYDWARQVMADRDLARRWPVLLSPIPGRLDPAELAAWMLADRLDARLQLQLHKLLWPEEARGV